MKEKKETDEDIVNFYKTKTVSTEENGGDTGKIIAMARRKIGGRKQWRIKVRFTDGFEKWYSKRDIDTFLRDKNN